MVHRNACFVRPVTAFALGVGRTCTGELACSAGDLLRLRICLELLGRDDIRGLAEENDFRLLEVAAGVCWSWVSELCATNGDGADVGRILV